ncbi:MAG: glycosyltransferase [Litorilinea sp.]
MTTPPRVTVLTATYNGTRYLAATIESVLAQTFEDFEYVVVDDASTDESAQMVADFAARDARIRLVRNAENLNPAGALNRGLAVARGEYLAILDHDDLALPNRLAAQVAFLDAEPDFGAVGAQARCIDETGATIKKFLYPVDAAVARWNLFFGATLLHSASMYRRALVAEVGGYSAQHKFICDYDLLIRLAERSRIGNLPDELTCYRRSTTQVSANNHRPQTGQMFLLQYAMQARWLGVRPSLQVVNDLVDWLYSRRAPAQGAVAVVEWMRAMWERYVDSVALSAEDTTVLGRALGQRWMSMAHTTYAGQRELARVCWSRAWEHDPLLLQRPENWQRLRELRQRDAEYARKVAAAITEAESTQAKSEEADSAQAVAARPTTA